jgi:hypothetical protein
MLPAKFGSIWPSCFRGEDFFKHLPIRKKELILAAMFVGQMEPNEEACNFEVNLITRLGVVALFSSLYFSSPGHVRYCHHLAFVVCR